MKRLTLALLGAMPLWFCSCDCPCLEPNGARVDLYEYLSAIERIFDGEFTGVARDSGGASTIYTPCAIEGSAFTLSLSVAEPHGCDTQESEEELDTGSGELTGDCSKTRRGVFGFNGTLIVGQGEALSATGGANVWSTKNGVQMAGVQIGLSPNAFPWQTVEPISKGLLVEEYEFLGIEWGRRLSEDDAAETVWERCTLEFGR